ncbi:MAG: hypothetical protein IPL82_09835 [Elusimicrobia bacterium]|nr:hypothetical protein [Elusimicrobiota bacterium]
MGKEKDGWEIMAGRKPEFDIPPDGYETAPVAVADDAPPDGYEGPSTGYKGVGASGSWDQPQPAVVPQPVVPHIQMPQNPDAMSTYKEALTAYLVGNRDLAKAKAEAALSLDTGLTEAKNMLTRMRVNPLAGTNAPRPEYSPQKFTDYTVGQMAADTYNAIDQSPVVRTLGSGVARIGAGLSRVPNLAANIFALPYNTIVTLTGNEDMAQRSPKMFEKEARWWDEKATQLSEGFRRWGSKGEDFVSVAKRKDPGEIASYIAYKVLEEAPQQAIVIGTTMAGIPAAGLSYMGASSSAQELAATPENVNPAAATVNAIVNGTVEAALEQTPALMGKWSKAIEEAVGKKGRGEVIKAVAKTIGSSIVQEGLVEEAPTEYLQSASRVMTGVDPNAMQGVGGRMIEAATIGGAMGGGMTAPAAIGSGIQMGAGKLGPGDFPPDGFNENNTPQGPIPPSSIGQSVAPLDIKQNPNYSLGDESARLAGSSDSVVNVPGVLDLRRGADAPVVPADRVLPSAMPADANIPAPVQSPGNYERVALPQSPAIPNLEQPAPAESQSALPQPPQLDQQQPRIIPAREARVSENELNRYPVEDRPRLKSLAESIHKEAVSDYQISRSRFQHWREILGPGIKPPKIIGGERDTMGEYNTLPVWQKSKAGREMDRVVSDAIEAGLIGDEKDIYDALRKLQAPRRPISPDSFLEEAANIMAYETEQESIEPNPTYPISTEIEGQFQAEQEQSNLFDVPKENVGDSYVRLIAQARRQGMTVPEAVKFAKARISQFGKQQTAQTQAKQSEFGVAGGVQGFGVQRRGQTEMFQVGEETTETAKGQTEALAAFNKIISASKMTDAVFAELVDSIRPDPAAFRKGYGTEYSADKFAIRGATYPIRNHPTIRALVRFAKGAHQGTGYHEAMHVILNNVLTVQERQVLMDKFGTEEQAAEAFARYEAKRTGMEKPSRIKAIFDKILELLGQLRSYMAGKGWKTAEDVFKSVEQGRTERRRAAGRGEAKYQAEKQKDQTGTEAFKRWFGDSKVVDADGKPLVVYHGTSEKGLSGDAFSKDLLGAVTKSRSAKAGFYFVANKDAAAGYSRLANSKPVQDLIDKSNAAERAGKFDLANRLMVQAEKLEQTASPKENVVGAYLSIQKPFEFDASEQRFLDIQNEIHDAIREAKTGGYDGIVFRNLIDNADWGSERALDHWVAFEPTQIKSATGNAGTFDPENPSILYQAERVESDKAMLPNGGYVPLAKLSKLQRIYRGWLTTDRGVGQAIDRANEERIGKIMETAFDAPVTGKQLLKYFKENPSDDLRQAVFEALTGQRSIFELPADITGIVQKMREDVDALSRVIAQTAAPNDRLKAVIERNLGRYLGRHYKLFERKNWRPSNEVISRAKAKLREMHPNTIGKASSQELNGIIENIISKGDVTFHRGDRRIDIPQNHFVKRKDIPKEIRDLYGEITDPVWAYLKTMADQSTVAHNADFLSKISGMEGVFKDKPDETHFKQIPDVARWGAVRGKFTTQEVNDFLIEAIDPVDSGLFRFVEKLIVNPFKWTKTVASLPSHPRNFIGNTMFSVLAGNTITNPANIPYYWKALRVIMGKEGKYRGTWKELVRARVADTQFWGSEMPKLMAEMISDPVSWPDKIMNTVKWPVEKLGELYNNEDLIYRVSAFLKYRDNGMTINQAAQEVDKWFTNYARLPKAVKTARRIGVFGPFLSFKANTARILINAAKESGEGIKKGNPAPALRLAFVVSFIPLLQMAMRTVFDIDDDEKKNLDKLQDMGPIYKRNSTPIYYRTAEGSIKAFDLGYIWPTGEFDKAARAALVGDAESFTESIDLFQHPLFDAYSILFNNFNTRNRQNVANVNDPMPRRAADKMAELARMLYVPASSPIPSIRGMAKGQYEPGLLTGYQIKTLYDAYHGVEDRFGRTREVPEELRAFFTGIRTWEIRPDDTKKAFRMRKAGEFQEAKRELRRYMRMPGISQEEKERRMDDWKRRVAKIRSDVESSNSVKLK